MLKITQLKSYQLVSIIHCIKCSKAMLWLGMGLGKTIISLTAIVFRMKTGQVRKTLVVAPLNVVYAVWKEEALKWEHTKHLRFSILHDTEKLKALFKSADVYIINYEGLNWLSENLLKYYPDNFPFDLVIFDEIPNLQDSQSVRVKGYDRKIKDINGQLQTNIKRGFNKNYPKLKYTIGLTGTPSGNSLLNLFGQYLALDAGKTFGKYITRFKDENFTTDYNGWSYKITELGKKNIYEKIAPITLNMETRDYLDLPPVTESDHFITLPKKVMIKYKEVENDFYTELETSEFSELGNDTVIETDVKIASYTKCLQLAGGFVYTDDKLNYETVHLERVKALKNIMLEASGNPILVCYRYKSEALEIKKRFKKVVNITETKAKDLKGVIKRWQDGQIRILLGHPASMGHGIDGLQHGGHIVVHFGSVWSMSLYQQVNARLDRQGQTKPVSIIRIIAIDTLDELIISNQADHAETQSSLKMAVQEYRRFNKF